MSCKDTQDFQNSYLQLPRKKMGTHSVDRNASLKTYILSSNIT